jgi:bifunctional DNA-binding transcriptional regulator/antitoxin component of YhaV-PrlF toxin-antitoxin module
MPRKGAKILKANGEAIVLETTLSKDYRIAIPKSIRHFIDTDTTVNITIKKTKEENH